MWWRTIQDADRVINAATARVVHHQDVSAPSLTPARRARVLRLLEMIRIEVEKRRDA